MPKTYRVQWTIDILEAKSPQEAARNALEIQRDCGSSATLFKVRDRRGRTVRVDAAIVTGRNVRRARTAA